MKTPHPTSDPAGFPAESLTPPVDDGGAAFPRPMTPAGSYSHGSGGSSWTTDFGAQGMSLRDWFAGMALNGWVAAATGSLIAEPMADGIENAARQSYRLADAMLAARKGGGHV